MKEEDVNTVTHLLNSMLLLVLASLKTVFRLMREDVCFAKLHSLFPMEHVLSLTVMSSKIMHVSNVKEGITLKKEYFVRLIILTVYPTMKMATANNAKQV